MASAQGQAADRWPHFIAIHKKAEAMRELIRPRLRPRHVDTNSGSQQQQEAPADPWAMS